jgi:hypothetical protein
MENLCAHSLKINMRRLGGAMFFGLLGKFDIFFALSKFWGNLKYLERNFKLLYKILKFSN